MEEMDECSRCGNKPPECEFCERDSTAHYAETEQYEETTHWVVCEKHREEIPHSAELIHEWTPVGECDDCGEVRPLWGIHTMFASGMFCDDCSDTHTEKDIDADVTSYPIVKGEEDAELTP